MRLKSANTDKDARLDIKAKGFWRRGQTAFFDVRVTHVNSQTNANKDTKVVFNEHEQSKKRGYLERVLEIEHASFTPLVLGTNGGMGTECQKFVSALASKLAEKQNEESLIMEVLGLDFTTALISTVVFVVLAVLLYIFSIFGVREKTYEEALEEQRKRNENSLFQSKNEKTDKSGRDKKFRKPWGKRAKEKSQTDKGGSELSGNESGPTHEHVVFKPETEVIPSDFDFASKTTPKSKKNKKSTKPILLNKDEESPKKEGKGLEAEEDNALGKNRSNSFSLTKPRDEVELKYLQQVSETAKQQSESSEVSDDNQEMQQGLRQRKKASKVEEKDTTKQELAHEAKKEIITPAQSPSKKQKKNKLEILNMTGDSVSATHLVNMLKNSILSDVELQQLIDILLNRQQGGNSEWTRKGDPVAALKKQLQEKEQALEDEQRLTQSANAKLKEIRAESSNEKSRFSQLERQLNVKMQAQQQEMQALHNRMCHSHEQQVADTSALQSQLQQAQSALNEDRISLQRITEENNRLKEALSIREAEASNMSAMNHLQLELEKLRSAKEQCELANNDLRCKVEQLNNAETTSKQEESVLKQHITDLTNKLNQAENNKQSLIQEIAGIKSDSSVKDTKVSELQDQSVKFEKKTQDLETRYKIKPKEALAAFIVKITELNLTNHEDKPEDEHQKNKECGSLQTDIKSFKSQVSELTNQYNNTKSEVDKLKAQNKSLSAEIESSKDSKQNGDLNGHKSIEIIEHDKIMEEKDKVIAHLKDELNTSLSKLNSYKADLDTQLKKNNELREKNWKIMDAMSNIEKTSSTKLNECNRAADEKLAETISLGQNQFRQSLQKMFPVISLDNKTKFSEWLSEFEKEALNIINQYSEQKSSSNSKVSTLNEKLAEMEDEKSKLENKVQNYKSSLIETETILQKLQESVNASEKVWEEKLHDQEKELKQVVEEKQALSSKITQVQASQDASTEVCAEVCGVQFAYSCIEKTLPSIVGEMQTELKNLEAKLQTEELERKNLAEKYEEANKTTKDLQKRLEETEKEMDTIKKEHESIENLTKVTSTFRVVIICNLLITFMVISPSLGKAFPFDLRYPFFILCVLEQNIFENPVKEIEYASNNDTSVNCNGRNLRNLCMEKDLLPVNQLTYKDKVFSGCYTYKQGTELNSIKLQFEKEQKTNKELTAQTVKLNSLVKIGSDSLKAETKTIDKLREELKQFQIEKSAQDTSSNQELKNPTTPIKESIETIPQQIKKDKPSKKKRGGSGKK
ncbi:Kinectin [Nymphon striatum]|nr:Kinectin [Nymphon striatum]